jgi:dihydrofolate reductase
MRLTTITQITVDGVMQANGHATEEELASGFTRDGWALGVWGDDTLEYINRLCERADAYLLGRKTYEIFAPYWGDEERVRAAVENPGSDRITTAFNSKPKYVASNTLTDPEWAGTTVLSGDLGAAIRELKTGEGELQVHGSGALVRWLLANDLVDEIILFTVPVILGQGTRLFPADGPDLALEVLASRTDEKGVTTQVYRPDGRPRYSPNRPTA